MMNHAFLRGNALSLVLFLGSFALALLPLTGCVTSPPSYEDADSPAAGMVRLAEQLQARGDNVGATMFYQRALQQDPNDVVAHRGLAKAFEQTGHLDAAVSEYKEAIRLKPSDSESQRNLGRILLTLEQPAEAREAYQAALDLDGNDTKAMNGLAVSLDYLGDHGKAQTYFKDALREDPDNLATVNNLAYSYIVDGKYRDAIDLLEPNIKSSHATPALRQNLALAYGLSGMDLDAERIARMDLSPAKVKENLAYYKRRRAELAVDTAPYAEVGTYATQALAEAQIAKMQPQMDDTGVDLKPIIAPQVGVPGGTPRFAVRMMGCTKPDDVKVFCDELAKKGLPCMIRNEK